MDTLETLIMFTNGEDCVIATNEEDAKNILSQTYFKKNYCNLSKSEKKEISINFTEFDNDEPLTFYDEEGFYEGDFNRTRTVQRWIEYRGRGLFGTKLFP